VMTYQMLSGRFPYGVEIAKARSVRAQQRLVYNSLIDDDSELPHWVDDAINRALHVNPLKRYSELSEFIYDLRHPNKVFLARTRPPLIQRNPIMFWQGISFILFVVLIVQQIILG
jgi:serine/threonine protein kinase